MRGVQGRSSSIRHQTSGRWRHRSSSSAIAPDLGRTPAADGGGSGGPEAFLIAVFLGVIPDDFVVQPMLGMNSGEALLNVSYLAQVSGGVAF